MIKTKKSIILIILAIITIANYSNAQENTIDVRDKLMIGLKAGFNLSNVYDAQGEQFNADAKFGLAAGAFVAIPIGVQPQIVSASAAMLQKQFFIPGAADLLGKCH